MDSIRMMAEFLMLLQICCNLRIHFIQLIQQQYNDCGNPDSEDIELIDRYDHVLCALRLGVAAADRADKAGCTEPPKIRLS